MDAIPGERAGTTSGLLNTARQMGGSLGVAAFGAVLATQSTFQAGLRIDTTAIGALLIVLPAATIGLRQAR